MAKSMSLRTEIKLGSINLEVISLVARRGEATSISLSSKEPGVKRQIAEMEARLCDTQIQVLEKLAQKIFDNHK